MTVDMGVYDSHIRRLWKIMYWCLWLLNWIMLPVFIERERTGSWRNSIRNNSYYWFGYFILGVIFLFFYLLKNGYTGFWNIYDFFYAMAYAFGNAYGLVLISLLLGYAFVALPQWLTEISQPQRHLDILYARVVACDEDRLTYKFELEDKFAQYRQFLAGAQPENTRASEIFETAAKFLNRSDRPSQPRRRAPSVDGAAGNATAMRARPDSLASVLTGRWSPLGQLADALGDAQRSIFKFDATVTKCIELEDFLYKRNIAPWRLWVHQAKHVGYRLGAYVCGFLSVSIILAQATIFVPIWWFSIPAVLYRTLIEQHIQNTTSEFWTAVMQVMVAMPLTYAYLACFWAAFRFKLSNAYGLYPNHNTDAYSLMWCASIMSRTAFSLCYNYIFVLRLQHDQAPSAFMTTMTLINMVPLFGHTFTVLLPFLILVLAVLQYTQVYHKTIHYLGLSGLQIESAVIIGADNSAAHEGRNIVAAERTKRTTNDNSVVPSSRLSTTSPSSALGRSASTSRALLELSDRKNTI